MDLPIYRLDQYTLPQPQISPSSSPVELEITRGRVQQRRRAVRSKIFLIGAASDCDLVLGDLQFPEAYAYLFVSGSEVTIRRLGSGPELTVGGQSVETAELFHDDLIAFGPFELRLRVKAAEHSQTATLAADESQIARIDQAAAVDEVEALLLDIRRGLAEDPWPLATAALKPLSPTAAPLRS